MFSNKNLQSIGENEGKIDSDSIMRPIQTEFLYFSTFTAETESFDNRIKRKLRDRVSHSQNCRIPFIKLFCKSVFITDNGMVDLETKTEPCYLQSCTV